MEMCDWLRIRVTMQVCFYLKINQLSLFCSVLFKILFNENNTFYPSIGINHIQWGMVIYKLFNNTQTKKLLDDRNIYHYSSTNKNYRNMFEQML